MMQETATDVVMIPIEEINVINPRVRNRRVFDEIVDNISDVGLKRPITVSRREDPTGPSYDLVCGQGRLEACQALGQSEVPALVVDGSPEDCLVSSLVENCARRQHRAIDLLQDISGMKERGYSTTEIAEKTGLSYEYVWGVTRLLENGEQRLLQAVESGTIPISVAVTIADAEDQDVQAALQTAYENKELRGTRLIAARRLVEVRRRRGKSVRTGVRTQRNLSSQALVKAYEEDTERKRAMIRRSEVAKARLTFIIEALKTLVDDDGFFALLEEEELSTLPGNLAKRMSEQREEEEV